MTQRHLHPPTNNSITFDHSHVIVPRPRKAAAAAAAAGWTFPQQLVSFGEDDETDHVDFLQMDMPTRSLHDQRHVCILVHDADSSQLSRSHQVYLVHLQGSFRLLIVVVPLLIIEAHCFTRVPFTVLLNLFFVGFLFTCCQ